MVDNIFAGGKPMDKVCFEEVEHTADWAYRVWGKTLSELFVQATLGLYSLAGLELAEDDVQSREIRLQGVDAESLLVAWLNELLYLHESENLAADKFEIINLDQQHLYVRIMLMPVQRWQKEIKAVTYNNLSIRNTEFGLETTLVLDV